MKPTMFPTEEEKARETPLERDQRRARTGVDRHGLNQLVIVLALVAGGVLLVVAADVARLERRWTTATVTDLDDSRRRRECVTTLATGFGEAHINSRSECRFVPWRIGDTAPVVARRTRFTKTIVVSTGGTIFADAYSMLPD